MSQQIQPYRETSVEAPLGFAEVPIEATQATRSMSPIEVLRRRWLTVVLLWPLLAGPIVACIWLGMKPTYTASAQIQVAPTLPRILYDDENTRVMPLYGSYLNTQARRISSYQVLTAAVADPTVQGLPLLQTNDPVGGLRGVLLVKNVKGTHLLEVSVTQDNPDAAVRLTKAVVDAYMERVVEAEMAEERKKLEFLENEREQLRDKRNQERLEIRKLAEEYGTATESMFDVLRQSIVESTLQTKRELERVDLEIIQLREKLKQLEEGVSAGVLSEDDAAYREEAIENDFVVRALREQLLAVSTRLVQLRSTLTDEHKEVIAARERKEHLEAQLDKERIRAAKEASEEIAARRQRLLEGVKARLRQQLAAAEQTRRIIAKRVEAQDAEGMAVGRRGLEIQALREQAQITKKNYDSTDERIRQLQIERQRPARVTIASGAEMRPDGVKDKRRKFAPLGVAGALFVALSVALLKHRLDPHLHAPQEVETEMGLRVLGAVPCVSELRTGRATQEDFIESYRLVRASLSACGPDDAPPKSILVTSAQAGEGKTSLAVSLAASLAETGGRVLLLDGDTQAPSIGPLLKLKPARDLTAVLLGEQSLEQAVTRSRLPGVDVLVAGANGGVARGALNNKSALRIIREAADRYDHVVIDSPPTLGAADVLVWAHVVDGVIISTLAGYSDVTATRLACRRLRTVGASLLGAVVGNVSTRQTYYSYSAGYRSDDGRSAKAAKSGRKRSAPVVQLPGEGADCVSDEKSK